MSARYRYLVAALLFAAGVINYLDRSALSVVAPVISQDLGLSAAELGIVFSSFFFGYALFNFIGGYLADRFGPKRVFAAGMGAWSIFCGLTAAATGLVSLLVYRVLFGMGEGPMATTTNKTITNWFPRHEAASVIGITFAGQPLGSALAGPVVGLVAVAFSWRVSFVVIALLGLTWVVLWQLLVTDHPSQHPRVQAAERRLIETSRDEHVPVTALAESEPLWEYLRRPSVLAVALAFFSTNYVLFFFLSWLPSYLSAVHQLNLKDMSIISVIPWLVGCVGYVVGGLLSDMLFKRTGNGLLSRKAVIVGGLGGAAACVAFTAMATSVTTAIVLIAAANLFLLMAPQATWALVQEMVPASRVGGVGGFAHFLGNVSGIVGPAITGFIVQYGGGYGSSFVLAGAIALIGACGILFFVRGATAVHLEVGPDLI
jgi:MFS transporter, ACS family, hexuronate transporter